MAIVNTATRPWYRYPFVWMVLAIPFSAVVMGVVMIWLAITTDDGLVADDYYKQGMAINRDLHRDALAQKKGISAELEMDNSEGWVKLRLNKGALQAYPETLELKLQYATQDDEDAQLVLNHGQGDQYIGIIKRPLTEGKWYLELNEAEWRLNGHMNTGKRIKLLLEPQQ